VDEPETFIPGLPRTTPREPVMTIDLATGALGVISADGADHDPQPAPLSARTRKE